MTENNGSAGPDFDHLDVGYDLFLPFLRGANDELLAALECVPASGRVLDLACGAGEPALTLAARRPDLQVLGIDTSIVQIEAARARAAECPGGGTVQFEVMSMDALKLETGSIDAVMSRMGALLMGDSARTAREAARVLAPGGRVAIAVWSTVDEHPAMSLGLRTLRSVLPAGQMPDLSALDDLAADGVREGILREAGLSAAGSGTISWVYTKPNFESWWSFVLAIPGPMQESFRALEHDALERARHTMAGLAEPYHRPDGAYEFPVACQLVTARR